MKFLCPQCKAKYRIADEKLAQRSSSRMKCRKCGHVIDIHSATMPDSIRPPAGSGRVADGTVELEDPAEVAPSEPPRAVMKSSAGVARRGVGATAPKRASATTAPAPKRAPPPRRGAAAIAEAVPQKSPLHDDEEYPAETKRLETQPAAQPVRRNEFEEEVPTRIHDGAALAAAFSFSGPSAAPSQASGEDWYVGIEGSPIGPLGTAQIREKATLGKVTAESLVWKEGFEEWKALRDFPELLTIVEEAARAAPIPAEVAPATALSKDASPDSEAFSEQLAGAGIKRRRPTSHPMAWVAIFVALALGVTIGGVLLSKVEKQEVVKYVEVPGSAKATQEPVGGDTVLEEQAVAGGGTKHAATSLPKPEASAPAPKTGLPGLSGLNGLNGLGPATQGPDTAAQGPGPGGQLDGISIQRSVAGFTPGVRRGCWDTALSARAADAPSSARVGVTITIEPSGSVSDVQTGGDPKGYPGLARCIEAKVRGWHFPRSGGTTTANVPFVFAAQ